MEEIKIGNQIWHKENLDVETFRNGDAIPHVKTREELKKAGEESNPAWCYYLDDPNNSEQYGKLYNWYAVHDPRGLAPIGWHVPSDNEWDELIEFLGGKEKAADKLKADRGWEDNGHGTNESGFSGRPVGHTLTTVVYWSCTEKDLNKVWCRCLYYMGDDVLRTIGLKTSAVSVRCIKD